MAHKGSPLIITKGFFGRPRLLLAHARAAHTIMASSTNIKPAYMRRTLEKLGGTALLTVEGEEHTQQRRLIGPAFHPGSLAAMHPVFVAKTVEFIAKLKETAKINAEIDLLEAFSRLTLDVIGVVALGHDFKAIAGHHEETHRLYNELMGGMGLSYLGVLQNFFPPARVIVSPAQRRMAAAKIGLDEHVRALLAKRRAELSGQAPNPKKSASTNSDDKNSNSDNLLDSLLKVRDQAGRPLTDEELKDQTLTFLLAGHETSSVALSWCAYALDCHRPALERLRNELDLGLAHDKYPEGNDPFPYLDAVIKEAMRLYPPVAVTVRVTTEPTEIAGIAVPQGVDVIVPIWALHRNPEVWGSDADEFRPERFLEGNLTAAQSAAYLPFYGGRHRCIGERMAFNEIRVVLAAFVREFEFKTREGYIPEPKMRVTMRPKDGMPMVLGLRA